MTGCNLIFSYTVSTSAIIAAAIISGAVVERTRFLAVYGPLCQAAGLPRWVSSTIYP